MKKLLTLILAVCVYVPLTCFASDAGARGGKLVETDDGKAEILIEESGIISIAFYNKENKQVAPTGQVVSAIAEAEGAKATLAFSKKENLLIATSPLPKGEGYTIVVQIKDTAEAKPHNIRLKYEMHKCGECNNPEYACTCDH